MKGSWKKVAVFVFVVAITFAMGSLELQAGPASARGNFELPFDASLGKVSLAPGNYTYSVNQLALDGTISIYQGTTAVAMLRAQSFSSDERQGVNPVLLFVRHDGNITLRALRLPKAGTFYFALPKELRNLVAQQPQLIETIPVQVSGD